MDANYLCQLQIQRKVTGSFFMEGYQQICPYLTNVLTSYFRSEQQFVKITCKCIKQELLNYITISN